MSEIIRVGIADVKVAMAPNKLRTSGLGSCVGVTLFDPVKKIAGLAHIMLPSSEIAKEGNLKEAKFADTAIPLLISLMEKHGGLKSRFKAKLVGGAEMFKLQSSTEPMRIGPRNVEACRYYIQQNKIPILYEETGGNCGRTIEIDGNTGSLFIRTVNQGTKEV